MTIDGEFDYIVVGAGSAGCVLANRLSADLAARVLLIEAGGRDRSPWLHIPSGFFKLVNNPRFDWRYATAPEPNLANRAIGWPRGKVLGGSSAINGMIYIRGQAEDYDHWRQLGNPGWAYADLLPLFRRSERQMRGADAFHGGEGGLAVSDPRFRLPLVDAFVEAACQSGLPRRDDFNGAVQEGAGYYQLNIGAGRRSSSANAFLKPARSRPNLRIVTDALVDRIGFCEGRANAVHYSVGGEAREARCAREIVLCAGAIGSPAILQRSGVGDPSRLASLGIPVVHALPGVGRNLQDHLQVRLVFRTREPVTLNDMTRTRLQKLLIGLDYVLRRRGILSFGASLAGAFARTDPRAATPDIQLHFQPLSLDSYDGGLHTVSAFTISACQLRPESRGELAIVSRDPAAAPDIRANYLATEEDRAAMIRGFRLVRGIAAQPALASRIASEWKPGTQVESDDDALDYIRATASSIFHPAGTCAMGPGGNAVVDAQLRVHGVGGLRVADCSIMPTLVSGNTNAAAIVIGEKAAELMARAPVDEPNRPVSAARAPHVP